MSYEASGPRHEELPPVDPTYDGDGHDFIDNLSGGWVVVPLWGSRGWNLGEWPYVIIAACKTKGNDPVFGVCYYVEHDVTITSHASTEEQHQRIDELAEWHWRHHENGPKDLPPEKGLLSHHRGPYFG